MKAMAFAIVGALSLLAGAARGQEKGTDIEPMAPETAWETRRFSLLAHLGLFTPLGLAGASGNYAVAPPWLLEVGIGTNGSSFATAAGSRVRLTFGDYLATGMAVGLAYGHVPQSCSGGFEARECYTREAVPSAYADVYLEARSTQGFLSRLYAGVLDPLRPNNETTLLGIRTAGLVPYIGVALGTAL